MIRNHALIRGDLVENVAVFDDANEGVYADLLAEFGAEFEVVEVVVDVDGNPSHSPGWIRVLGTEIFQPPVVEVILGG